MTSSSPADLRGRGSGRTHPSAGVQRVPGLLVIGIYVAHLAAQIALAVTFGTQDIEKGRQFLSVRWPLFGLAAYAVLLVGTIWATRTVGSPAPLLGLRRAPLGRALALVPAALVLVIATNALLEPLLHGAEDQGLRPDPVPDRLSAHVAVALSALAVCAVGPFVEELFFRGLVHGWLRRLGVRVALPASALVFGLVHFVPSAIPVLFIVGLVLAWLYERTGSIWPGIALHVAINTIAFVLGLAT